MLYTEMATTERRAGLTVDVGGRHCAFLNGLAEFCRACGTLQWRCPSGVCLYQSSLEIYIWEVTAVQMVVTPGSSFDHQGLFGEEEEP